MLSEGSGSCSLNLTPETARTVPPAAGRTTKVMVAEAPASKVPRVHTSVPPSLVQTPCEEPSEISEVPAGNTLVSTTPVARAGPRFVTVVVKVTAAPGVAGLGDADSARDRLARNWFGNVAVLMMKILPSLVWKARRPEPQLTRLLGVPELSGTTNLHREDRVVRSKAARVHCELS